MSKFLFAWGSNQHEQCLLDNNKTVTLESGYDNRISVNQNLKYINCGASHCVFLTKEGHVYGWGNNNFNQLNYLSNKPMKLTRIHISHNCTKSKVKSEFFESVLIKQISCGSLFTIFVTRCNCIVRFGSIIGDNNPLIQMDFHCFLGSISKVSCGQCHVVLLLSNGQVACFGRNMYGQIGIPRKDLDNNVETVSSPRVVTNNFAHRVIKIAAGAYHTLCVDEINQIYCWGYGIPCGVLNGHIMQPSHLPGIHESILAIVGGSNHSLFLTNSSKIFSIGSNEFGQSVPNSQYPFINYPTELEKFDESFVKEIFCSDNYSLARTEKDDLFIWGKSSFLVENDYQNAKFPKQFSKISLNGLFKDNYKLLELSCGSWHIVCHISSCETEFNDDSENNTSTENSSDSESVELSSENNDNDNNYSSSNNIESYILFRERTHTTLNVLYSETIEQKPTEKHSIENEKQYLHKQFHKNPGKLKEKHVMNLNNSTEITNIDFLKFTENQNDKINNLNFPNNTNKLFEKIPQMNLQISSQKTSNQILEKFSRKLENERNHLKKSKTELVTKSKERKFSNCTSLTNAKENLKFPILVPGLVNLELNKEYGYKCCENFKFSNKIKAILERSKTYCKSNKL